MGHSRECLDVQFVVKRTLWHHNRLTNRVFTQCKDHNILKCIHKNGVLGPVRPRESPRNLPGIFGYWPTRDSLLLNGFSGMGIWYGGRLSMQGQRERTDMRCIYFDFGRAPLRSSSSVCFVSTSMT